MMRRAPAITTILLATIFAAALAMESAPRGDASLRETIACIAIGLLLIGSGHCAFEGRRLVQRMPRGWPALRARSARAAVEVLADEGLIVLLAIPLLAASRDSGASLSGILDAGVAIGPAAATGVVMGVLAGVSGATTAAGAIAASSIGALLLWPASLGWMEGAGRFPRPDLPAIPFGAVLVLGLVAAGAVVMLRGRRERTP